MMTEPFETLPAPRIRRSGRGAAAASLAALLLLAGCAADPSEAPALGAGDPPAAEEPAPNETEAEESEEDAPAAVELGTAVVGGATYSITELRNCEPFEQEGIDVELELQGFGEAADGERVQIDVYVQAIGGAPFNDVSWAGPEGVFGAQESATVDLGADRVSGSATVVNALTPEGELPIEFDLEVPGELIACR